MTISIEWSTEDIVSRSEELTLQGLASPLTDAQANTILHLLKRHHDASVGINWDIIDSYIMNIDF